MELVDVVDSKSTASDSVPVRVRPPAPKKKTHFCVSSFFNDGRTRTGGSIREPPRGGAQRQPIGKGELCAAAKQPEVRPPAPKIRIPHTRYPYFLRRNRTKEANKVQPLPGTATGHRHLRCLQRHHIKEILQMKEFLGIETQNFFFLSLGESGHKNGA